MSMRNEIVLCFFLALVALAVNGPASGNEWADVRQAGDFQVRATFALDAYPQLIPELARLERDITTRLKVPSRGEPVHLLLFADKTSYQQYVDRYFRGAPARRALFVKGSQPGWVMAYVNDQFEVDVRHESTHALLHSRLPMVPLWLDEGLAEYFEVPAEQRQSGNPHRSRVTWAARFRRMPDLRELEGLRDVRRMGRAEYQSAWAWVHFLMHGPPAAQQVLIEYLGDIAQNRPPGRLSDRLSAAIPDLKGAFLDHHRGNY